MQGECCRSQTSPKTQHLSVYQELSGELSLIRAVGNLSSRDEDLSATAALAGQDEQSPLPGLCPISVPPSHLQRAQGPFTLIPVPGQRALVSLGDMAFVTGAHSLKSVCQSPSLLPQTSPCTSSKKRPQAAFLSPRAAPTVTGTPESLQTCAVHEPSRTAKHTWNTIC